MSIWIELMCDVRKEGADATLLNARCHSHRGASLGGLSTNATTAPATIRFLTQQAIAQGWKQSRGQWTCPGCQEPTP